TSCSATRSTLADPGTVEPSATSRGQGRGIVLSERDAGNPDMLGRRDANARFPPSLRTPKDSTNLGDRDCLWFHRPSAQALALDQLDVEAEAHPADHLPGEVLHRHPQIELGLAGLAHTRDHAGDPLARRSCVADGPARAR